MNTLELKILKTVCSSPVALTIREICCAINGINRDFCMNVDGRGGRCKWFYRRPRHEKQAIRLVKPPCRFRAIDVISSVNELARMRLIKRVDTYLRDRLSAWGMDRHVLVFIDEQQLRNRTGCQDLLSYVKERGDD